MGSSDQSSEPCRGGEHFVEITVPARTELEDPTRSS